MKKKFLLVPLTLLLSGLISCSTIQYESSRYVLKAAEKEQEKVDLKLYAKHMYFGQNAGDCTLIQVGDKNILIDTGPKDRSFESKLTALNNGKPIKHFDYVIITHQDDDHTGNFQTLFDGRSHTIGTLIDFDSSVDSTIKKPDAFSNHYAKQWIKGISGYQKIRARRIKSGTIQNYLTASQCSYKERIKDGEEISEEDILASVKKNNNPKNTEVLENFKKSPNVFKLAIDKKHELEIKILYNKFSATPCTSQANVILNNMTVCSLITYGETKMLFTGDLMEFNTSSNTEIKDGNKVLKELARVNGETELVNKNYDDLKDGVTYFRGGHHGSNSSNSQYFASVIRPQYVFWSNGSQFKEFDFPRTTPIINMGRYTDKIFVSTIDSKISNPEAENKIEALHGQTTFVYDPDEKSEKKYKVDCSNKKTPDSLFLTDLLQYPDGRKVTSYQTQSDGSKKKVDKELENREYAFHIYNLTSTTELPEQPIDCTYVKIGHVDILFGAGCRKSVVDESVVNKIKYLCNDKVLDYVIVPSSKLESYSYLVGKNGLFSDEGYTFKNVIYRESGNESYQNNFVKFIKGKSNVTPLAISDVMSQNKGVIHLPLSTNRTDLNKNYTLNFLDTKYVNAIYDKYNNHRYSIATLLKIGGKEGTNDDFTYLHLGMDHSYGYENANSLKDNYFLDSTVLSDNKVDVLQLPNAGYMHVDKTLDCFYDFVSKISKDSKNNKYAYSNTNSKNGLAVLCNGVVYKNRDGQYMYPHNLKKCGDYKYVMDDGKTEKRMVICVSQKAKATQETDEAEGGSKVIPFSGDKYPNGDLCMRVTMQPLFDKKNKNYYTKITYGVNRNYGELDKLFFCIDATDTFDIENKGYGSDDSVRLTEKSFK